MNENELRSTELYLQKILEKKERLRDTLIT